MVTAVPIGRLYRGGDRLGGFALVEAHAGERPDQLRLDTGGRLRGRQQLAAQRQDDLLRTLCAQSRDAGQRVDVTGLHGDADVAFGGRRQHAHDQARPDAVDL